jgi:hypothetical protein
MMYPKSASAKTTELGARAFYSLFCTLSMLYAEFTTPRYMFLSWLILTSLNS